MEDRINVMDNHQFDNNSLKDYLVKIINTDANKSYKNTFEIKQFVNGQSNPTFYINFNDIKIVLRKKPHGKILPGAHMIDREFRIISKLYNVNYPVPKPIVYCNDTSVIGTEFYLMEYVEGRIFRDFRLQNLNPDERYEIFSELIRVIAQLQKFDVKQLGLEDYGKIEANYFERQINTWTKQYRASETQVIKEVDFLIDYLPKNIPNSDGDKICLVHGDFRLDNVIFHPLENKIIAVLDWELSTLGSRFADVSYCAAMYFFPVNFLGLGNFDKGFSGIPSETEFKSKFFEYLDLKHKKPSNSDWYYYGAFSCFKLAGIAQGVYKRSIQGNASSSIGNTFLKKTLIVAKLGYQLINKSIEFKTFENRVEKLKNEPFLKFLPLLSNQFYETYIKLEDFMEVYVYPNEKHFIKEIENLSGKDRWSKSSTVIEKLKLEAKNQGLWNLFLPEISRLTNLEYALISQIMGRSIFFAPEIFNCSAPDTGNAELLFRYATHEQKKKYLEPLLSGEIRSCFAMTEKGTPSSDATNLNSTILLDPNDSNTYIVNGRKWWISGAGDPRCSFIIFMGKTPNQKKAKHDQHTMILIDINSPGVKIIRPMKVFGYDDAPHGHMDITFDNVRVPKENVILGEGKGFEIAQGRLGPGRIHHCMRIIGATERALENLVDRTEIRKVFGKKLNEFDDVVKEIATCKINLVQARLLVLFTAYRIDQVGAKNSKNEIAMIKIVAPKMALKIIDKAIQIHGAEGISQDVLLPILWSSVRTLRIADGPDEVHLQSLEFANFSSLPYKYIAEGEKIYLGFFYQGEIFIVVGKCQKISQHHSKAKLNLIEDNKDLLEESNESNSQIKLHSGYSSFSENVEKDFCNLRIKSESSTKLFSNDENKKMQNDSTSILSDSSDGCYSENLTDSESTKKKRNRNKFSVFDSEYPKIPKIKINQRSKSQMIKSFIENVVNEEIAEDDYERENEYINKKKPLKFSNISFNDDLPSKISKNTFTLQSIKTTSFSSLKKSIRGKSQIVNIFPVDMDPVVEDKEEEIKNETKHKISKLNSPRVKFMTDNKEDVAIHSNFHSASSFHYVSKDYSIETDEIIAEDNNENIIENDFHLKKKDSSHKILENVIDREEEFNYNVHELNVNAVSVANFETIKEEKDENMEEEHVLNRKISTHQIAVDEFHTLQHSTGYFRHTALREDENLINELDEDKEV